MRLKTYLVEHILCIIYRQNYIFETNPCHVQSSITLRVFTILAWYWFYQVGGILSNICMNCFETGHIISLCERNNFVRTWVYVQAP